MSVIFEEIENIKQLAFTFTAALKLDKYLYYIENETLKRIFSKDNSYNPSESTILMQSASQISTDGKSVYCLNTNGDIYKVDQQSKLLIQGKNYTTLYSNTAIDHSGRGYYFETSKLIYSHCKHISTFGDRTSVITIGGKFMLFLNDKNQSIPQINGLKMNCYFKKSILFSFGGLAITENGDAYCFNSKMIRLKVSNLEDIAASQKYIFAIQGKNILQWKLEDLQHHQFFQNFNIFQKMNYGNDITIPSRKQTFKEIHFIQASTTQYCFAKIKENNILSIQQDTNNSTILERTFCRSSVNILKQQLFEDWDGPKKLRSQQVQKTDRSDRESKEKIETKVDPFQKVEKSIDFRDNKQKTNDIQEPKVEQQTETPIPKHLAARVAMIKDCLNFDQPQQQYYQSQCHSLYTLNEEASNEHSGFADEDEKAIFEIQRKKFMINDIFEDKVPSRSLSQKIEEVKEKIQTKNDTLKSEVESPSQSFTLNTLLNKISLSKPEKTLDSLLQSQQQIQDQFQESLPTFQNDEQFAKVSQKKVVKSFLRDDSHPKIRKNIVNNELEQQQSIIDFQNGSAFLDVQQDSFINILEAEAKGVNFPLQMTQFSQKAFKKPTDSDKKIENNCLNPLFTLREQDTPTTKIEQAKINLENLVEKIIIQRNQDSQEQNSPTYHISKKLFQPNNSESKNNKSNHILENSEQKIISSNLDSQKEYQKLSSSNSIKKEDNQPQQQQQEQQQQQQEQPQYQQQSLKQVNTNHSPKYTSEIQVQVTTHQDITVQDLNVMNSKDNQISFQNAQEQEMPKNKMSKGIRDSQEIIKKIRESYHFGNEINNERSIQRSNSIQRRDSQGRVQTKLLTEVRPEKSKTPMRFKKNIQKQNLENNNNNNEYHSVNVEYNSQKNDQQIERNSICLNHLATTETVDYTQMYSATDRIPEKIELRQIMETEQCSPRQKRRPLTLIQVPTTASIPTLNLSVKKFGNRQSLNTDSSNKKRPSRNQEIVLRKLFFRLDIHIKLAKLEFMFGMKSRQ